MTILIAVIHAGLAAAWVGGMAYSLLVVQPKLQRFFEAEEDSREALTAVIASGNRWKVLGLVTVIAVTGLALLWLVGTHWWIHAIKAALLLIATGIFLVRVLATLAAAHLRDRGRTSRAATPAQNAGNNHARPRRHRLRPRRGGRPPLIPRSQLMLAAAERTAADR